MKRFKIMAVMLAAMWAIGLMAATSAFALPDISITLGSYPLHLNYLSNTVKTTIESTSGAVLSGEGWHVLYLTGELTALGTFRAIFLKWEKGTEKCFNQGEEANGEVLTEGSFHIVYTSLAGSATGLTDRGSVLSQRNERDHHHSPGIKCPTSGIEIKVKGFGDRQHQCRQHRRRRTNRPEKRAERQPR